jgi:5-hydroxyisourate hydrolase-like protein (transthyretin family)
VRTAAAALAAALFAAVLVTASPPPAAHAEGPPLAGLVIEGPLWRAENRFMIDWSGGPDDRLGYRMLNASWAPNEVVAWPQSDTRFDFSIPVPPGATPPPGEYQVRLWLVRGGPDGDERGPPADVVLRYDDATPGLPGVSTPAGWLDGRGPVPASLRAPAAVPLSGIVGYAASISALPGGSPCALPSRCGAEEIDFFGAAGSAQLQLGALPEGVEYLNVVAVSGSGVASPVRSVPIYVDRSAPAIRFAGVPEGWVSHPVAVTAIADDPAAGMTAAGPTGPFTAVAVDGGAPTSALSGSAVATVAGEGLHRVAAWGRDALGNVGEPASAATTTVRIDATPPRAAFAAAQRPQDPELIEVAVADALSGPSPERGSIEIRPAGTSRRFEPLPVRMTAAGLQARWSSDDFPPGSYEFRATAFDGAGNSTRTTSRADGTPMVLGNPIKLPTALESGFGGATLVRQHCHRVDGGRRCRREAVTEFESRPATWTVPFGRSLRFGGILRAAAGAPLARLPVEVVETFAGGADLALRRTTVVTRADGRFDARLAPGPSRQVEAFFPGTRTLTRAAGRAVTMAVRAGVRFGASSEAAKIGGEPVRFSGRLLADEATIPRTGRPIELQFRIPGGAWTEFRSVQTDRHGRFRYPYAFTDDDSRGIRFRFRAVSPDQSGWPYRPAASPPVAVTGY